MENIKRKKERKIEEQERKRGGCSSSGGGVCVYRPVQLQPRGEKKVLTKAPTRFIPPLARQLPTRAHTIFLSFPSFIHSIYFFSCSFFDFSSSFYSHSSSLLSVCCVRFRWHKLLHFLGLFTNAQQDKFRQNTIPHYSRRFSYFFKKLCDAIPTWTHPDPSD